MDKRVTLHKLITYVSSITGSVDDDREELLSVKNDETKPIDKIKFVNLNKKESKTVGDFPTLLRAIFDPFVKDLHRHGVIQNEKSLLFSVLTSLDKNFYDLSDNRQIDHTNSFRNKLLFEAKKRSSESEFFTDKEMRDSIGKFKNNRIVLYFLADYFNLNLFVANVVEDKIYVMYPEPRFNYWKPAIFLSFFNDIFEPLSFKGDFIWDCNNDAYKKIMTVDKLYINVLTFPNETKNFELGEENLEKYLENIPEIVCELAASVASAAEEEEEEQEDGEDSMIKTLNPKMLLKEIQQIAVEHGIELTYGGTKSGKPKNKTKVMLINELKNR